MNDLLHIPHGGDTVKIELTVKEAMSLCSGVHFHQTPAVASEARNKIKQMIMDKLLHEDDMHLINQ